MHAIKSFFAAAVWLTAACTTALAWNPVPVEDDPLVRMPGTQPGQATLESSNRCLNCHAGYNSEVEPGFNWKGSMMAQSARDFLFWSCFTVSAQDSIWAVGTPNATDICERCHFPKGWLEGRSDRAAWEQQLDMIAEELGMEGVHPDPEKVARLVVMGGNLHGVGNVTPAAEFNAYADPEVAASVLTALGELGDADDRIIEQAIRSLGDDDPGAVGGQIGAVGQGRGDQHLVG